MVSFTPQEGLLLRILAINHADKESHSLLFRTIMSVLSGEAHLAGLMILGTSPRLLAEFSKKFSPEHIGIVRRYCDEVVREADQANSDLEARLQTG